MTGQGPFAALTFIAGPALLTNASTVLLLGTINRYARALDRARSLADRLLGTSDGADGSHRQFLLAQLDAAQKRVLIIVCSLTAFYVAIGAFALGTLSFLVGETVPVPTAGIQLALGLMLGTTMLGAACLICGTALLAWESRISFRILRLEAEYVRRLPAPPTKP